MIISPSILNANYSCLEKTLNELEEAGADWLHLDIMDGNFVPNLSFGPKLVKSLREKTKLVFDVHLMLLDPIKFIPAFFDAGADIITVHAESKDPIRCLKLIREIGLKAGLSIKPSSDPSYIVECKDLVDLALIMSVEPGFGGQKFMPSSLKKIEYLSNALNSSAIIEVDGGINDLSAKACYRAGADALVAGNYIINAPVMSEAIISLRCQ